METKQQPVWAYSLREIAGVLAAKIDALIDNGKDDIDDLSFDVARAVGADGDVSYMVFLETEGSEGHYSKARMAAEGLRDAGFDVGFFLFLVNGSVVI